MANSLLYIVTGAIMALMAARHFLAHTSSAHHTQALHRFPLPHTHYATMHWAEATICGAILLTGLWLAFAGALSALSLLLHLS